MVSPESDGQSMNFEVFEFLSWREVLVAVVALLVLYILFAFLRINRLQTETRRVQELSAHAAQSAVAAYSAVQEPSVDTTPEALPPDNVEPVIKERAFPWNEPPPDDGKARLMEALEMEVAQLRRELGGLRAEVQMLRDEQRRALNKVQVAQNASPYYSDAMQLAVQGREASDISVLCGISRAEAELVVALAKNQDQLQD